VNLALGIGKRQKLPACFLPIATLHGSNSLPYFLLFWHIPVESHSPLAPFPFALKAMNSNSPRWGPLQRCKRFPTTKQKWKELSPWPKKKSNA
jgi:hypothetical protein